jgi:glycine/D-amino acid oxidase-like deaminating enzyme
MKIAVVGAGVAGLTLAWALSRRGHDVAVYEQGSIHNPVNSSYDEHRTIRYAYGELTGYAALMPGAFAMWDQLFDELGARHFEPTGIAYVLRGESSWYEPSMQSLAKLNVRVRELSPAQALLKYPMLRPEGLSSVVEEEGSGILFPMRILTGLTALLARRGVKLHAYTKVDAVDFERGTVTCGRRVAGADIVVVTTGAWVADLVPELKDIVIPSRQAIVYFEPPSDFSEAWAHSPVIAELSDETRSFALPPRFGNRLKFGRHTFTKQGNPNEDRTATEGDLRSLRDAVRMAFRDVDRYQELERKICYYTVHEKEEFIVKPVGKAGWVISACSGHGFKLQPLITDGVARAITGERSADEISAWAAGKLSLAFSDQLLS